MKIGIITFHWATNYGAILQAYCLQEYLRILGHDVDIINYKPRQYDFSWLKVLRHPKKLFSISKIISNNKKESLLISFREKNLNLTKRFFCEHEIADYSSQYDVIISGSDQILNPYFTLRGEANSPTSVYFLGFAAEKCKCLGYAVSFGCTVYPENSLTLATKWVQRFDSISVREKTGLNILTQLSYNKSSQLVPDPTILYGRKLYNDFGISVTDQKQEYTCVYMLRRCVRFKGIIKYIDDAASPLTMEEWLTTISQASAMITNSYHGMIMAILAHVPFVVILETGNSSGMNDRFFTLLSEIGLEERIVYDINDLDVVLKKSIDFSAIDIIISKFKNVGIDYLANKLL